MLMQIEAFLRAEAMPWTRFGRLAVRDPRFVQDLRNGREPRPETRARIAAFIARYHERVSDAGVTSAALRDAVMRLAGPGAALRLHSERACTCAGQEATAHRITLRFAGDAAFEQGEAYAAALYRHEFTLPGVLVADAQVAAQECRFAPEESMTIAADYLLTAA